jgi:hypothetical protein
MLLLVVCMAYSSAGSTAGRYIPEDSEIIQTEPFGANIGEVLGWDIGNPDCLLYLLCPPRIVLRLYHDSLLPDPFYHSMLCSIGSRSLYHPLGGGRVTKGGAGRGPL